MTNAAVRAWLAEVEDSGDEPLAALALLAGRRVRVDEEERHAALRRAALLLAAGGDPRREVSPGSRAVVALADDLDADDRRRELLQGLDELADLAADLPGARGSLAALRTEPAVAWRWYACGLLAEHLLE